SMEIMEFLEIKDKTNQELEEKIISVETLIEMAKILNKQELIDQETSLKSYCLTDEIPPYFLLFALCQNWIFTPKSTFINLDIFKYYLPKNFQLQNNIHNKLDL